MEGKRTADFKLLLFVLSKTILGDNKITLYHLMMSLQVNQKKFAYESLVFANSITSTALSFFRVSYRFLTDFTVVRMGINFP